MSPGPDRSPAPRWLKLALRVVLVTFLLTLLSFAVCLLLGIAGLLAVAALHGGHPNMTIAYRQFALPAAAIAAAAAVLGTIVLEVRHVRKSSAL